jgi:hypothetical protein
MRVFIDTNLWAYRLDRREPPKSERLRAVASRKLKPPFPQLKSQPYSKRCRSLSSSVGLTR